MSEFGAERQNAGGAGFGDVDRLDPALHSFKRQFPNAAVTLYTDFAHQADSVDIVEVVPPFDTEHPRYGWRAHDYYQSYGLLKSTADIAIAMDSDMLIVSDRFQAIVPLVERFGLAAPANPRLQVSVDATLGDDSNYDLEGDPTQGTGFAFNLTPLGFSTQHEQSRRLLKAYCRLMRERPGRGGLRLWQAAYEAGFSPYLLPFQWCVCTTKDLESKHIYGNEIVLHLGHPDVYPRYLKMRGKKTPTSKRRIKRFLRDRWPFPNPPKAAS